VLPTPVLPVILVNTLLPEQLPQLTASLALTLAVSHVLEVQSSHALNVPPTTIWIPMLVLLAPKENSHLLIQMLSVIVLIVKLVVLFALQLLLVHALPAKPDMLMTQLPKLAPLVMTVIVLLAITVMQDNAQFAKILKTTWLLMVFAWTSLLIPISRQLQLEDSLPPFHSLVLLNCLTLWVEVAISLRKWLLSLAFQSLKLKSSWLLKVQSSLHSRFTLLIPQSTLDTSRPNLLLLMLMAL